VVRRKDEPGEEGQSWESRDWDVRDDSDWALLSLRWPAGGVPPTPDFLRLNQTNTDSHQSSFHLVELQVIASFLVYHIHFLSTNRSPASPWRQRGSFFWGIQTRSVIVSVRSDEQETRGRIQSEPAIGSRAGDVRTCRFELLSARRSKGKTPHFSRPSSIRTEIGSFQRHWFQIDFRPILDIFSTEPGICKRNGSDNYYY